MKEIGIHESVPGQVLAEDVFDERGGLLLAKGAILSTDNLQMLEIRGVLTLRIEEFETGTSSAEATPSEYDYDWALRRLDHMFEGQRDDLIMGAIYAAARGMIESARRN